MLKSANKGRVRRRRVLAASPTLQLLGGIVFAVILPWFIRILVEPAVASFISQINAGLGTMAALLGGQIFLRSLTSFPGIRGSNYVVPMFTVAYGIVLAVFFFFRFDYSRIQFIASFALCIAWYVLTLRYRQRNVMPEIAVVPGGNTADLQQIDNVSWTLLDRPQLPVARVDGIVADLRADLPVEWERFLAETALAGVPVYHHKQIAESLTGRVEIEHLSENNFGSLIPGLAYVTTKFLVDWIAAALAAVLLSPVLIVTAIAVRLDSPGPILFRQRRMGYRGQPFTVLKFRTMTNRRISDADPGVHDVRRAAITQADDDRVTRTGRFMRRSRLDELPQIFNILRGEMSWIGPRPEAMVLSEWYERELPFYRYRHIVRPGITGWAQVNQGHVAEVDEVLWKLHFDFYYIKYFTPWLDLLIVFRTVNTILTGFGSK